MQPPHQHSRNNLDELKGQLVKKLGPEGFNQYFYYLQRFLSMKLSKVEFNKLCLRVLGRENIPLHNQLIRSILRNACYAKFPPPASYNDDASKHGFQHNGSHIGMAQASDSPGLSNGGEMAPVSPRKARSGSRDKRSGDRRNAILPNGKAAFPQLSTAAQPILENGVLNSGRPVQDEKESAAVVYSKEQMELVVRNDRKEAFSSSPLQAPLGVPFCPVSIGGACRALPTASSSRSIGTRDDGTLLENHTLRDRMEHIALAQGLEGVSMDCADILNHGLDSYIKGLLKSCIELMGARSGHDLTKNNTHENHASVKLINGVKPGHQFHMPNSSAQQYQIQEQKVLSPISLQEFRVAMELNPRKLGEDWPLLVEKICTHVFEE